MFLLFPSSLSSSLLFFLCAVIPAPVARIASVGSDLDIRSLAPLTNPTIVFHWGAHCCLSMGIDCRFSHKEMPVIKVRFWIREGSPPG